MRRFVIVLVGCTLLLLAGYAGYRSYKVWKQNRMVTLAKGFLAKGDVKNAVLALNQALAANFRNLEANRLMADLTAAAGSPATLIYRSRVVELNPQSTEDRLALVRTAMLLRDLMVATNALAGVTEAGKQTPGYHNMAGTVAAAMNDTASAEIHFLEASRLEPTNPVPVLNLAVIRLQSTNAQTLAEARASLLQLKENPAQRCSALRELLGDAIRHNQTNETLALSRELVQQTNATFRDKILRLTVLKVTRDPVFKPTLAAYQREAATNGPNLAELANWQTTTSGPTNTLAWLRSLPVSTQTNQPCAMQIAQCYAATKDWRNLQSTLSKQSWGELELIRHAFLASALRGQDLVDSSKTEWEIALKAANGTKAGLTMLLRLAAAWNWATEAEDILSTIVKAYPGEKWASQTLSQALYVSGRTKQLMALFSQESKRNPADLSLKNNLAMTAMLLNAQEFKPYDLALEVYQKAPTNSNFAATYAFALYSQKKKAEALQIFQKLPAKDLENPSTAGYYGLVLKATGNAQKAKTYLDLATKPRAVLLPEERKLFADAKVL